MGPYINALTLNFQGKDGKDVPSGNQIALTWGVVGAGLVYLLKS